MSFNLDSLFIEWRAKVPTGIPNIKNAYHLVLLKEICLNKGIDTKIVDDVILTLEQDNSNKLDDKEREKAKKMGLVSKGFGNYGKDADGPTTHKVKNGKLVAVDDAQEDEPEDTSDKIPAQDFQSDPDKGGDYLKKKDDVEDVDAEDGGEESKQNISDENQKIVSDFESRVDKQNRI